MQIKLLIGKVLNQCGNRQMGFADRHLRTYLLNATRVQAGLFTVQLREHFEEFRK